MTAAPQGEDWPRLAVAVAKRIDHLGLQQSAIQDAGGPSPAKLRDIIRSRTTTLRPSLRRGLELALEWPPGAIDNLLAGAEPPTDDKADLTHMSDDELLGELCRRLALRHEPQRDWDNKWTTPPFPGHQDPGMSGSEDNDKTGELGGR